MHSPANAGKKVSTEHGIADNHVMTGAEAIASILSISGIRTIFAYPGTSEIPLCEAISHHEELSLINSRGDKEAAFMAAGGNVATSNTCAAILHGARGLTNALGAIAEVRRDEIPVLYIVGMPSRASAKFLPPHGEPDLIHSAGAFAKVAYDCSSIKTAEEYIEVVTQAVKHVAQTPFGPVLLGVPQDLLSDAFVRSDLLPIDLSSDDKCPDEAVYSIVEALVASKKPVILVDDYVFRSHSAAETALAKLSELLSAPVFQVGYRRGPMLFQQLRSERVPNYAGLYQPTNADHFEAVHSADLLITIEDRNMYPRVLGPLPNCLKIALTSNEHATLKNGYLHNDDIVLIGDVASNILRLTDRLRETNHSSANRASNINAESFTGCPAAVALVNAIANGLQDHVQPMIVDDSQMFGGLIANNYGLLPRDSRVFGSHGGFVGCGLPIAVGLAATHREQTVVCTLGDQGFTNSLQALAVAGEQEVPLLIVVCNNGSSVSLRKQSKHEGLQFSSHPFLENNECMSYAAVARGFGLSSSVFVWPGASEHIQTVIDSSAALTKKITEAISARKPHLLELIVPGDLSFWEGVWNVEGLEGLSAMSRQCDQGASPRGCVRCC